MLSLISINRTLGHKFKTNACTVAAVSLTVSIVALALMNGFYGVGSFLPPSLLGGYLSLGIGLLFGFDTFRYLFLDHSNKQSAARRIYDACIINRARDHFMKNYGQWSPTDYEKAVTPLETNPVLDRLPKVNMTFYFHGNVSSQGFPFCYGKIHGEHQRSFVTIPLPDGLVIMQQLQRGGPCKWPLRHPEDNSYFIPQISHRQILNLERGIKNYLEQCLSEASHSAEAHGILESLVPYAEKIYQFDSALYERIRGLIQRYPDLQPAAT